MPEEDAKTFGEAYQLYEKWRSVRIETEAQWIQITQEFHDFVVRNGSSGLALRLATSIMDHFDDLYLHGKKPEIRDYIGRGDL